MNIKEKFLQLTSRTYPHGTEYKIFDHLPTLDMDDYGNLYLQVGSSDVMFTSHLDTAGIVETKVCHVISGDKIMTNGKSILGADDKAGVTIMLYMIENKIPGLYYFFLGEEVGCLGSKKLAEEHNYKKLDHIKKVISFDKRGTTSVVTFQRSTRCCSDKFANQLADELNLHEDTFNYAPDKKAFSTDSYQFIRIYPECTNISVGYQNEHTFTEYQNIDHLERLAEACLKVNWNNLPVDRDPYVTQYDWKDETEEESRNSWRTTTRSRYLDEEAQDNWSSRKSKKSFPPRDSSNTGSYDVYIDKFLNSDLSKEEFKLVENQYKEPEKGSTRYLVSDKTYNEPAYFTLDKNGKYVEVEVCDRRMLDEEEMLVKFLESIEVYYSKFTWNGVNMELNLFDGKVTTANRNELQDYLEELNLMRFDPKLTY